MSGTSRRGSPDRRRALAQVDLASFCTFAFALSPKGRGDQKRRAERPRASSPYLPPVLRDFERKRAIGDLWRGEGGNRRGRRTTICGDSVDHGRAASGMTAHGRTFRTIAAASFASPTRPLAT